MENSSKEEKALDSTTPPQAVAMFSFEKSISHISSDKLCECFSQVKSSNTPVLPIHAVAKDMREKLDRIFPDMKTTRSDL